jgi:tetratricopeptide (TPR) repeat protein
MTLKNSPFLLLLLACTITVQAQTAGRHFKAGVTKYEAHQYAEAIVEFSQAIEENPADELAWYDRGLCKISLKDSSAATDLTKAIELKPDHFEAYVFRARCKFRAEDYQGTIQDIEAALKINPDYAPAYSLRGDAKVQLKDYEGALADENKAIALKPDYQTAYYTKGLIEFGLKDYNGAIITFNKVIESNDAKYLGGSYYFRGKSEFATGQKNAGCQDFDKALTAGYKNAAEAKAKYCP